MNVLESSGIENGGAVFPDISPIKGDEGNGNSSQEEHIEEMDVDLGTLCNLHEALHCILCPGREPIGSNVFLT